MMKALYIEEIKMTAMRHCRLAVLVLASICLPFLTYADTASANGYTWTYVIKGNVAVLTHGTQYSNVISGISPAPNGAVTIPSKLGGKPVTVIGESVFKNCTGLTSVTMPNSITNIQMYAFQGCSGLTSVTLPDSLKYISENAFPGCDMLKTKWYVTLANSSAAGVGMDGVKAVLTVTNVVVHHVTTSVQSSAVTPPVTTGIVNVIAEVGASGAIAVPSEWANQYSGFATKFGSDFTVAVTRPTGKYDDAGNAMYVWQDYVAGTDPTDLNDVFRASITFDGAGKPVISHSPELTPTEAAKRVYRTFGKVRLNDSDWTLVNGNEEDYNFFKVTVEMR